MRKCIHGYLVLLMVPRCPHGIPSLLGEDWGEATSLNCSET